MTHLTGRVQSGKGDASHWLAKFSAEYAAKLGRAIFPGSLNVALASGFDWFAPEHVGRTVYFDRTEYGGERDILLMPCRIASPVNQRAWLWTPTTAARDRPDPWVVELIADVNLRATFGLVDGSVVEIELPSNEDGDAGIGLARGTVRLAEHSAAWAIAFEREANRLRAVIADAGLLAVKFEHIGSTSVPGLLAKPIIDFMAGFPPRADARMYVDAVVGAGYMYRGAQGVPDRELFVRGSEWHRTHHFNLVAAGGRFWRDHLAFRDRLRAAPALRLEYAALKRELASRHADDRLSYTDGKADFVSRVTRGE